MRDAEALTCERLRDNKKGEDAILAGEHYTP
jgi:hypothetical protein